MQIFEAAPLLLIVISLACLTYGQSVSIKWPSIESESVVEAYQEAILSIANAKLNITSLRKNAQEDARDIINELNENLEDCKKHLLSDHLLWQYKVCVFQQLDSTDNQIWDLKNSLHYDSSEIDDDSQSSSLSIKLSLLICNLIILKCLLS